MDYNFLHSEFVRETAPLIVELEDRLLAIERAAQTNGPDHSLWADVLRVLHTIKGNSGMMGYTALQELAHAMEERARVTRALPAAQRAIAIGALLSAADALEKAVDA